ncbi:Uncharacterised protein [Mycobacteroides abscessus subsp. bolletii]|nr:Uncharacterised protein [Mycobacteroides abscessus subsp. bolletii]
MPWQIRPAGEQHLRHHLGGIVFRAIAGQVIAEQFQIVEVPRRLELDNPTRAAPHAAPVNGGHAREPEFVGVYVHLHFTFG